MLVLDILIVAFAFYQIYRLLADTRGIIVLQGIALIFLVTFVARLLNLQTLYWLLDKVLAVSLLGIIVIFQAEIKRALVMLGERTFFKNLFAFDTSDLYTIINAVYTISKKGYGALIVLQRRVDLKGLLDRAITLDAAISSELIETIFYHHNPLHDGAVIIDRNRVVAASAYLPLSEYDAKNSSRRLGTRHRAALGLSEQSDAVVIVVSEETGSVSIAHSGRLDYNIERDAIGAKLETFLGVDRERRKRKHA
ncbi:MAG: TIGR00159 family protein [Spirochaetes bacterium]|nr:TIGR00159 family protein [Spirochaetota bacterium]